MDSEAAAKRIRREPATFREVTVEDVTPLTARMVRVRVGGPELRGFAVDQPAASVRLLLPSPDATEVVLPTWTGNEFRLPDGRRPAIRTLTPLRADPRQGRLELDIVVHEGGAASAWALRARPGDRAALSGPGRGYPVNTDAPAFLVAGDESAIPAIGQLLEVLPADRAVRVFVEVAAPEARLELPKHPAASVEWLDLPPGGAPGEAMVAAVTGAELEPGTNVWAAGEAAAVQRIRRHLFDGLGLARSDTWIRGYWKHGRAGDDSGD